MTASSTERFFNSVLWLAGGTFPDLGRERPGATPPGLEESSAIAHAVQPEAVVGAEHVHGVDDHRVWSDNAGATRRLLRGDRTALGLTCFVGLHWTARILVDAFYFSHEDWSEGRTVVVGHILLTSLCSVLAAIYLGLVIWHLWLKSRG